MFAYSYLCLQTTDASLLVHIACKLMKINKLISLIFHVGRHPIGVCVAAIVETDKQRIAEVFQVEISLDDLPYEEGTSVHS
jgi:hypothetical protein